MIEMMRALLLVFSLSALLSMTHCSLFEGSAENVFAFTKLKASYPGIIVGTADINNDRKNDFFILNDKKLNVVYQNSKDSSLYEEKTLLSVTQESVKSVVTSDFNGDLLLDILLISGTDGAYKGTVYFGAIDSSSTKFGDGVPINGTFTKQPLLLQWNNDMLTDILVETSPGKLSIVQFDSKDKLKMKEVSSSFPHLATPAYSGFVDLSGNLQADIVLSVTVSGTQKFAVVSRKEEVFDFAKPKLLEELPKKVKLIGQPLFQDWNFDGRLEILLPVCEDDSCATSELYLYNFVDSKWQKAELNLDGHQFLPSGSNGVNKIVDLPQLSVISAVDLNLDQYPDCLLVVKDSKSSATSVAVLLNKGSLKFQLQLIKSQGESPQISVVTEFGESGVFDIATVTNSKTPTTTLYRQNTIGDAYFLKVMVLSGVCGEASECKSNRLSLGVPTPGPTIRYVTEGSDGGQVSSSATQVTHTSYMALCLPFHVFGLGPFANYMEKLVVSMPSKSIPDREHEFNFIVPKTELTIVPYPLASPAKWKSKLFIDPFTDKKVIYVAIALCGVCLLVLAIIILLQYMEVRADRIEKMQEAQKFNFDAM